MPDQYSRTRRLLGQPAMAALRRARVAVFGIGGVGGHVAEVLARSGVGAIDLFDSDTVSLTNLNRQLVALHSTLGQYKVDVMAARIADIDPDTKVGAYRLFYGADTADAVPLTGYDYVVDCIDTVTAKLLLAQRCHAAGVPVLSSMGAANKLDPTAFRVADIRKTSGCPLARIMRAECRKRGIPLKVVYSTEVALPPLEEAEPENAAPAQTPAAGPLPEPPTNPDLPETPANGRRTLPASNAFVPAACGLVVGAEVVKDLLRAAGAMR
ncbi:MAG: tRNA threonylcarbamoyladenosine dehydratase [Gemmiger sp.]|nr:tRNA threonylcarbamoyladenosine dehydratase [Gemmiger sp.]